LLGYMPAFLFRIFIGHIIEGNNEFNEAQQYQLIYKLA